LFLDGLAIPNVLSIHIATPCIPPQTMKFNDAPCHNPLSNIVVIRFTSRRKDEHLLPPSGI
jgi:hypothetical protein